MLEDDPTVALLIRQVLAASGVANTVEHFTSGADALAFLEGAVADASLPVLCILDLSLPDISGLEVLGRMRAQPALGEVPVIMLSGSGDDEDIEHANELGLDAYLVKPAGIYGLPDVIGRLGLPHVLLPRPG